MAKKVQFEGREFRASSFSGATYSCVGVSIQDGNVAVINTNMRNKTIIYTHEEWETFIAGVKNNEFNLKQR